MKKIFSFDAETNGLWGQTFAIAAVVKSEAGTISFIGTCPIEGQVNQWVAENVLPVMENIPEEYEYASYKELLKAFVSFYKKYKEDADIIVHMGLPVEARLFIDAHNMGILGDWEAPFPLIDISAYPEINISVDTYNKKNGIENPYIGSPHNPLYDSWAALVAYEHYHKEKGEVCF